METKDMDFIDLLVCPGFCVKENKIIRVNEAAARQFLKPGMELQPLLVTGQEEYSAFQGGCLYLHLSIAGTVQGASVTRMGDTDVFLSDEETEIRELQVLSLAAQELRMPLSSVIFSADQLSSMQKTKKAKAQLARLSRGSAQLHRIVCNMSDALRYLRGGKLQIRSVTSLLEEIFGRASLLAQETGITLRYTGLQEEIFTLTDSEQLERAVLNLISNALKFTAPGGTVDAVLTRKGKLLRLTVQDSGSGIAEGILQNIYSRYLRQPSLEDSRFGLGLGMVLVRAAARTHGGTVLIDQPGVGTRVTLTLAIRENTDSLLRSPVLSVDYSGERDHALLELSDVLPASLYEVP